VTRVFPGYPLILDGVRRDVYDRPVRVTDVLAGGAARC
jgi:hypothetical protein